MDYADPTLKAAAEAAGGQVEAKAEPGVGAGFVNFVIPGVGPQPGCRVKRFLTAGDLNEWAEQNRGLVIVSLHGDGEGGLFAVVARVYGESDLAEEMEVQQEARRLVAERRAIKEKSQEADALARIEREKEENRLRDLGRKCAKDHGGVIEDNSRLKKELKTLRSKAGK